MEGPGLTCLFDSRIMILVMGRLALPVVARGDAACAAWCGMDLEGDEDEKGGDEPVTHSV